MIPIIPALGNHEYYAGRYQGGYDQPFSEAAVAKFLSYFDLPSSPTDDPGSQTRYYRFDYGPIALIVLDVTNGTPDGSENDTNFYLLGAGDTGGGKSPGFDPQSQRLGTPASNLLA